MMKRLSIMTFIAMLYSVVAFAKNSLITPPEGLAIDTYRFAATALENGYTETMAYDEQVKIGFNGDDAYILGLVRECPDEFWCKATKNEEGIFRLADQAAGEGLELPGGKIRKSAQKLKQMPG